MAPIILCPLLPVLDQPLPGPGTWQYNFGGGGGGSTDGARLRASPLHPCLGSPLDNLTTALHRRSHWLARKHECGPHNTLPPIASIGSAPALGLALDNIISGGSTDGARRASPLHPCLGSPLDNLTIALHRRSHWLARKHECVCLTIYYRPLTTLDWAL